MRLWLAVLAVALLVTACAVPTKTEFEVVAEKLHTTDQAIVLFPANRGAKELTLTKFARCLKAELEESVTPKPKIMDTLVFQDAMFPWFEFEQAPRTAGELNVLLSRPLVRQRIASLNVRYLVSIAGGTEIDDVFPGLLCGGAGPGVGCLGLMWEDRTSRLNAVVWDIVSGAQAGKLSATTSGTTVVPAFIIPFPFIAYTDHDACQALARELTQRLFGPAITG